MSSRISLVEPRAQGLLQAVQVWGLPAMVAILLVFMWMLVILVSSVQRERLIEGSRGELTLLNHAVAAHATGVFATVETGLRAMERWLQDRPNSDPRSDARFTALVVDIRNASGGLVDLRLVSPGGELFTIPHPAGTPGTDVSGRSYFLSQKLPGDRGLYIGEPVKGRLSGAWVLPVSLRLSTPHAAVFLVVAYLDLDRLSGLYEEMRLKPNGGILILRNDGVALMRAPFEEVHLGTDLSNSSDYLEHFRVRLRGAFISDAGAPEGSQRLVSYQRLGNQPVVVVTHRTLAEILDTYSWRRSIVFGVAGAITLLAALFTWVLFRSQQALREAKQDLEWLEATDSLTGVMSRRAFLDAAQREFNRARRYGRPAAVLILDLDLFKHINDSHGHAAGDGVLIECAAAWKLVLREQDLLGRVGGEEFCVVLPESPPRSAAHAAERLRKSVLGLQFHARGEEFGISVSVGVAMVAREDKTLAQTMERADQALYRAKAGGRNRVETADESALTPVGSARDVHEYRPGPDAQGEGAGS